MCIALLSTAHPRYALILLSNRDEYLNRPTASASFWPPPHAHVLGGRDLLRPEQGSWLAINRRNGRVAVLTNFSEGTAPAAKAPWSRGRIVRDFVAGGDGGTGRWVERLLEEGPVGTEGGVRTVVGGFSLVCGTVGERLAVVSNRSQVVDGEVEGVKWILGDAVMTVGLSNATFGSEGWGKVDDGEELLLRDIRLSEQEGDDEEALLQRFLKLLSTDTLPRKDEVDGGGGLTAYVGKLKSTIFVPALGKKDDTERKMPADEIAAADKGKKEAVEVLATEVGYRPHLGNSGMYGTQKQTVLLVEHGGRVRYFERTLFDENSDPVPLGKGDVDISFPIGKE